MSVIAPSRAKATEAAAGLAIFFVMATGVPWLLMAWKWGWTFPASVGVASPVLVSDVVKWASCGNPVTSTVNLVVELNRGVNADAAVLRVGIDRAPPPRHKLRPSVEDEPVKWWELSRDVVSVYGNNWRRELRATAVVGVALVGTFHVIWLVCMPFRDFRFRWEVVRMLCGFAAWGAALGGTIGVAVRAANAVAREREKDTLEALMLAGMTCREVLRQKWHGCVRVFRPLMGLWLGVLGASFVTFGLHPGSVFSLLLIAPIHVCFAASVGLYFSVRVKNVSRANTWLWATLGLGMFLLVNVLMALHRMVVPYSYSTEAFPIMVVVPVAASAGVVFLPMEWHRTPSGESLAVFGGAAVGTVLYAVLARVFWRLAVRRFEREWKHRTPPGRPP